MIVRENSRLLSAGLEGKAEGRGRMSKYNFFIEDIINPRN
jgi:hypothetical protein